MPITLDHVALASADITPAFAYLVGTLGATPLHGGHGVGFRPMQVLVGHADAGMRVELLEPWEAERNDFLARFVARHTEGPHHLTFKVPDIGAAIQRFRTSGFTPVNINLSDPEWQEAFILPRQAHGTVVQIAQSPHEIDRARMLQEVQTHGPHGSPIWWPRSPQPAPVARVLQSVVLATTSLESALGLFAAHLQGTIEQEGDGWCELVWPNGSRLHLLTAAPGEPVGVRALRIEGLPAPCEVLGTLFEPA